MTTRMCPPLKDKEPKRVATVLRPFGISRERLTGQEIAQGRKHLEETWRAAMREVKWRRRVLEGVCLVIAGLLVWLFAWLILSLPRSR